SPAMTGPVISCACAGVAGPRDRWRSPLPAPPPARFARLAGPAGLAYLGDRSYVLHLPAQMVQRLLGCQLFGLFLRGPFGPADIFRLAVALQINSRLHRECLAMVRAFFLYGSVNRLWPSTRLQQFLQG